MYRANILDDEGALARHLAAQLDTRGYDEIDAAEPAGRLMHERADAERADLLVDLGAAKCVGGDARSAAQLWLLVANSAERRAAARAATNLGLMHEHLGEIGRAVPTLIQAVELASEEDRFDAGTALARCYVAAGDLEAAMRTLANLTEELLETRQDDDQLGFALVALGDVASQVGDDTRADRAWRSAVASRSEAAREVALERLGPADVSAANALTAIALDRADRLARAGRRQDAIDTLTAIDGSALDARDHFRLVDSLLDFGLVNQGIDELETLIHSGAPEHELRAAFTLGEIYRTHQMLPAAESMYRRAVDSGDSHWAPRAAGGLAEVLDEMGEPHAARTQWALAATSSIDEVRERAQAQLAATTESADLDEVVVELPHDASQPVVVVLTSEPAAEQQTNPPIDRAPTVIPLDRNADGPRRNPYAALAPAGSGAELDFSADNPYAELAPANQAEPRRAEDPEHWREMLADWPDENPGFFARFSERSS